MGDEQVQAEVVILDQDGSRAVFEPLAEPWGEPGYTFNVLGQLTGAEGSAWSWDDGSDFPVIWGQAPVTVAVSASWDGDAEDVIASLEILDEEGRVVAIDLARPCP
jgi:hypothetical protein